MIIEKINSQSELYPKLQIFVEAHDLLFNSGNWLKNYPAGLIHQCVILNNNRDIIGCFVYYEFKKSVFKFIISPPFTPNTALFYINPSESVVGKNSFDKDLMRALTAYFDALKVQYLNINFPEYIRDTQPFTWKDYVSKNRYSYLIDLSKTKEELWNNLSSEKRKSINKAIKDGLVVAGAEDKSAVYDLVIQSLERSDIAKNTAIIKNILFSFANATNSISFIAYHQNKPVGASFCVIAGTRAVYLFGGFSTENKHHGAGVSCMWQSILKAKELNLRHFDFEGSMNPDIERYYREFGGDLTPYFTAQKIKPFLNLLLSLKKHKPF